MIRSLAVVFFLAALGMLAGCKPHDAVAPTVAAPTAPSPKATAETPKPAFDFEALLKREQAPMAITKLASGAGVLSAELETSGTPVVAAEKGYLKLSFPIGTGSPVECWLYDEQKDGASTIARVMDEVKKSLDVRLYAPSDVFVAGEHAVLVARAIYLADQKGVKAAGEIKLAFYNHPLVSALCSHDEPGYTATFTRVTKRLFETAQRSDRELRGKPAVRWEVSVAKLDGRPIGFSEHRSYELPDTHLESSVDISSTLYPRSAIDCQPEDAVTTETIDASGDLLENVHVKANGGESLELKVSLKRVSPGQYAYSGTQSGKPISGKLKSTGKGGLATSKRIAAMVKNTLLTGKAPSFEVEGYSPGIDPTAPMETLYELDSKEAHTVRLTYGPLKIAAVVDDDGNPKKISMNVVGSVLTIERLAAGRR